MTSLSEAAAVESPAAKRVQSEAETVSDVTAPTWRAGRTLGAAAKKAVLKG